jgi:hypothetical protein
MINSIPSFRRTFRRIRNQKGASARFNRMIQKIFSNPRCNIEFATVLSTTRFSEAAGSAGPRAILTRFPIQEQNFAEYFAELPAEKAPNRPFCSFILL